MTHDDQSASAQAAADHHRIDCWLTDMDGVLVHENEALPGAAEFIRTLRDKDRPFLVLTNNSIFTDRDLRARLASSGIDVCACDPRRRMFTVPSSPSLRPQRGQQPLITPT